MDGWKWTVDCPWASSHTNGDPEASVFLHEDGKPGFRCLHSHCHDKNWKDFQKLYDLPACGIVAEYNEKHALVNIEGKVRIMSEVVRPGEDFLEEQYQTKDDFMLFHSNDKDKVTYADGTTSWVAKAAVWLASPKRRQYSHIVFEPNGRPAKDVYNLFRGWNVSPSPGDWSLFNKHLLEIICDGNAEHHRWLLSWFARIIQDPGGAKPGTCPVLCGGQGTGKTTVGDVFGRLIRPHYIPLTKPEQLVGKFNQHLKGKLFICADEAFFAGARGDVGRLKSLITDRTITVEPKGIDAYATTNHINLMMCSNNSWVVPAEMDERRFFVLNVNPARAKDHRYFGAIHDQMEAGGYEGLFYDMLRWDYKQVNLREAPKTVGLAEQKLASLTPVASYWNDALLNGKIIRANDDLDRLEGEEDGGDWPESVLKTNVYNGYRTWAKKVGHKYQEHSSVFWRETTKLFGPFKERREGAQHNNKFVHIPPYAELVATWESKIGKLS